MPTQDRAAAWRMETVCIHLQRLLPARTIALTIVLFSIPCLWLAWALDAPGNEPRHDSPSSMALQWQHDSPWIIGGRVLDTTGKPIAKAHVAVVAAIPQGLVPPIPTQLLGQTTADENGTFTLSVARLPWYQCVWIEAIAGRVGYGLGVEGLDAAVLQQQVTFRLAPEQPVRGRLLDSDGRPAAGARVRLQSFFQKHPDVRYSSTAFLPAGKPPSVWPAEATTDVQGRFAMRGAASKADGGEMWLTFAIDDPRFAPKFSCMIRGDGREETTHRLLPARIVEGTVIHEDTKTPMAGAWLLVVLHDFGGTGDLQGFGLNARTDEHGRFSVRCAPGKFLTIYVYPPVGEPYPAWVEQSRPWPEGAARQEVKIAMRRGVLVRGKVVEAGSGAGIAGAAVEAMVRQQGNPYLDARTVQQFYWAAEYRRAVCRGDGSFEIAVPSGTVFLMARAPTPDFISRFTPWGELQWGQLDGAYWCMEGVLKIDPKPGSEPQVTIPLRRGVTICGRVLDPDGQVVQRACLLNASYQFPLCLDHQVRPVPVRDGRFELRGCDPARPRKVFFFDHEHQRGTTVTFDVQKAQREPPTIRLARCGSASVRFVDKENCPWAEHDLWPQVVLELVGIPAAPQVRQTTSTPADIGWPMNLLDPRSPPERLRTDGNGRVTYPTLIPGAPYKLYCPGPDPRHPVVARNGFTAEAGQHLTLPDVIVDWAGTNKPR